MKRPRDSMGGKSLGVIKSQEGSIEPRHSNKQKTNGASCGVKLWVHFNCNESAYVCMRQ